MRHHACDLLRIGGRLKARKRSLTHCVVGTQGCLPPEKESGGSSQGPKKKLSRGYSCRVSPNFFFLGCVAGFPEGMTVEGMQAG